MSRKYTGFRLAAQLVLLLLTTLFFTSPVWAQNLEVNVETSRGGELSGVKVYAFTESGSYTGKYAATDGSGTALFVLEDFADGTYKFRIDYLGSQFWSQVITIPGATAVEVVIEEETVEVTVTTGSGPAEGVRVYLFSESGSYLGIYEVTDAAGMVYFDLPVGKNFKFRADILGGQYWSNVITVSGGGMNSVSVNAGGGFFQVTVEKAPGSPMEGIKVYLFSQSGSYLGLYEVTNASGIVGFSVPEGTYKVRADYLGYQFWSEEAQVIGDTGMVLTIPHQPVEVTVQGLFAGVTEPIVGINVYLFNPAGSYLSQNLQTNASGKVTFELPEKAYKVRADYLGQQFWSEEFTWQDTTVNVPMADAEITVTGAGFPQQGVKVYLFSAAGSYLGLNETTDIDGKVAFRVPEGAYKFRVDYQGSQYWSPEETLAADQVNSITISVGGGSFTVTVQTGTAEPIVGVKCYVFNESGTYLGLFGATDSNGDVSFDLADGTYKFRADYQGSQFWSEVVTVPNVSTTDVTIEEETVEVTVTTAAGPAEGIRVYLFSGSGSYLGIYEVTDENGLVSFDLPVGNTFKFRADILGNQYWSDAITVSGGGVNNVSVNAGGGLLQVSVEKAPGSPMEGIKVYLFSQSGSYLGLYEVTDASGVVGFDVPQGTFKTRADYLGYQFWSTETQVTGDTNIVLTIPHQQVEVTVQGVFQGMPEPIEGIKVYLFSSAGSYLGQYQQTNSSGKVTFDLPEKAYKVRADYLGQQFWSEEFTWHDTTVEVPMADAEITVTGAGLPQEGVKVYVFSAAGSYLGLYDTTNNDGKVTFRIPEGAYKFRADEGGGQYWSAVIDIVAGQVNSVAIEIDVSPVTVSISADPETILLGESSTLTWSSTDADSCVIEPGIGSVDVTGSISVSPTGTTTYTVTATGPGGTASATVTVTVTYLSPSVGISADPETILLGESSTLSWSSADADTCVIDPDIGSVDVTGSISVSPTETTTYTITATGPGGTATATVNVTVTYPQPTVSISANPGTILQGGSSTLTWTSTGADSATIDQGIGTVEPNGSTTVSPTETTMYTITVTGPGGTASANATVTVTYPAPSVGISADPETIQVGESSTLTWSSTDADSCVIEPGIGSVGVTGAVSVSPTETTTYTITATGPGGSGTAAVTVTVTYLQPTVNIGADPGTILQGESSTMTWTSTNADSATIDPGIGTVEPSGFTTVSPTETTTYTITATGPGGTATASATITVTSPTPTVTLSADPETIQTGGSSTLTWTSINADTCAIEPDVGSVDINGSTTVSPTQTITYTITATGPGGTATDTITVTVNYPPSITVVEPDGVDDTADTTFTIQWSDADPDDDATISLYYDTDNSGADGTLIVSGLAEDPDGPDDAFEWDISELDVGTYYVYAQIDDGINAPVIDYSDGVISVPIPGNKIYAADGANGDRFGESVSISGEYAIVSAPSADSVMPNWGAAYVFKKDDVGWIEQAKLVWGGDDNFGCSVSISGDYAIVGADEYSIKRGTARIYSRDGSSWTTEATLLASDGGTNDHFGTSVSISGDYAIVGAPDNSYPTGAAYVFKKEGSTWVQTDKLMPQGVEIGENDFGQTVSINGDYAIVGNRWDGYWDVPANTVLSGCAYIFKREGEDWVQQCRLASFDLSGTPRSIEDSFANFVSINTNYAIVGAYHDDSAGTDAGAAYIYQLEDGVWTEQIKLTALNASPGDRFGITVSVSNSYAVAGSRYAAYIYENNGSTWVLHAQIKKDPLSSTSYFGSYTALDDQFVLLGVPGDSGNEDGSGAGYIYSIDNLEAWPIIAILKPSINHYADNQFTIQWIDVDPDDNAAISLYYDMDNSGADGTLIANGISEDPDEPEDDAYVWQTTGLAEGIYYVYAIINDGVHDPVVDYGDGTVTISHTPSYEIKLTSGAPGGYDWFGGSVSISGDYAIAGACGKNAAYILRRDGSIWTEQSKLTATDAAAGDKFGYSVSISGDYAIVGAYLDDDAGRDSGSAYIFKRDGEVWTEEVKLTASDAYAYDKFGYSVSISGDYAIVGAHRNDDAGTDSGSAYIFKRDGEIWTQQAKLTANYASDRYFGSAVSISEEYAIVGAFCQYDVESTGSAYIFKRNDSNWTQQAKLIASDAAAYDYFGGAVSISGDYAIVGARYDDDAGSGSGSTYIFKREGSNWNEKTKITANDAVAGDYFGYSVTISGDYIIVSARGDDDGGDSSGSAYIFKHYGSAWIQEAKITASDAAEYDYFGHSVSLNGGYAIIGAQGDDNNTGSVYIYSITTVNFSADPETIQFGESCTLAWSSTHADSCVIEPGIGDVDPNGSTMVSPTETTTYTITATGIGGTSTANVTVTVAYPPTVSIIADPETMQIGESSTLTWSSTHADSCVIEPDIGSVDPDGSIAVSPTETTTYIITATGPGGTSTDSVTVTISNPAPSVSIKAVPISIRTDQSSTLTWSSTYADSTTINQGIGPVDLEGSIIVSPGVTTTYTITATGLGGSATASIKLYVSSNGYAYGDPTPVEQAHLEAINRARLNPAGEAARLEIDLNEGLPPGTISGDLKQPLPFNAQLLQAARFHSRDMIDQQCYGHNSFDGRTPADRIQEAGYQFIYKGENIGYRVSTAPLDEVDTILGFHDSLFIDSGVEGRGHRKNILNNDFKEVGLGTAPGSYDGYPYCYMFTCDFASSSTLLDSFLLGVVYDDQNSDGIYTAGEGIENVGIVIIESGAYTSTASAGGYGLPLPPGEYTAVATLPDGRGVTRQISILDQNVKVDFLLSEFNAQQQPAVTINADPVAILTGESSTLSWASTYANSCVIDPGIGSVDVNGSITVSPTETTAYTITATGPGGATTGSVTVTVTYPAPTVSISADPGTIQVGELSTLSWSSTNADSASIDHGIGSVDVNGSITVSPTVTTSYTITVEGPGGSATSTGVVTVNDPATLPTVNISATPSSIEQGGSSTLSWTSTNANYAYINNGIGVVSVIGSMSISPANTTTYNITVTGPTGSASARATVTVTGNPETQPEGSFGEQYSDIIPQDATVEGYDPKRFSIITGIVHAIDDSPISGVSITVLSHPEFGTGQTDADGRFYIPVEGGETLTVIYQKQGLIPAQRKIYVPWNDIAVCETIQMIIEDSASTVITFDGNPETVFTHQSKIVTDEFGIRSCNLVFQGDNRAYLTDKEGNDIHELTTITARATEYSTLKSMPAMLPPTSAYTYCAELSVDGAERVRFDKSVIIWVDNFLGFEVGEIVPVGYYDRDRGVWVPSDNGVVVKLLDTDTDGIVDALDADGDDQPDDLNNNGSFRDEVTGLGDPERYAPGTIFWRVAVNHFSPADLNWPYGPPEGWIDPNPQGLSSADQQKSQGGKEGGDCFGKNASFVEERSRIFHEDIPVPGTDMLLHYSSNRVEGYRTVITVPASGENVPDTLERIIVNVKVAGRIFEQTLPAGPNQVAEFVWDGVDFLGRPFKGSTTALVNIGFVYKAYYYEPDEYETSFGQPGNNMTTIRSRQESVAWERSRILIQRIPGSSIAEGWTLSAHHFIDPKDTNTLHKGDGLLVSNSDISVITTVAGNGTFGYSGDGGPATEAQLDYPSGVAFDSAGNLYIADQLHSIIRKVNTDGVITTFAGNGNSGYSGDDGPATEAQLYTPTSIAFDTDGTLYIADSNNRRVRKVDNEGIITTVAGNGEEGYSGDGGLATEAQFINPISVEVDASGNLYIVDEDAHRIRKVDTNGIITTIAGTGTPGYNGDGIPATQAQLNFPFSVEVDNEGNLYISDQLNLRVRKVDTSGTITTVAGNGLFGSEGDGGPATDAPIGIPLGVAFDRSGNFYFSQFYEGTDCIRKVDVNGIITTIAGIGTPGYEGDGGPATECRLNQPREIDFDPSGNLYIPEFENSVIRMVSMGSAFTGGITFFEESGMGHVISDAGRHQTTIDLDTGVTLYSFGYDGDNNLISITDQFANETAISRDESGAPTSITSPYGLTTTLTIDAGNHLTRITYPDGSNYNFEYTADGLLEAKAEPEGNRFEHIFDSNGRLTDATDEEGGHWHYTRTAYEDGDILTEVVTGEGNSTSYLDHTYSTGAYTSTITDPTGTETLFSQSADGLTVDKALPCGMNLEFKYDVDTEYKFKFVKEMRETTPTALEKVTIRDKTYQDTNSEGIPDLITDTVTVNSNTTTLENDVLQSRRTITSPEGRTVTTVYDPATLLTTNITIPGLHESTYGYDTMGRLTAINTNTRGTAFTYNGQGFLESITDPEDHTTTYNYDLVGRMTGINRPDGTSIEFTYDGNGNMTIFTNPSAIDHGFGYSAVNLNSSYQTPISGTYSYVYDKDRRLIQTNFPSGKTINNIYDKTRLVQIQTQEDNIDLSYLCGTKVGSITKGTESITYGYDGSLLTSETLNGTLSQSLSYAYNNDFNVQGFTYAGNTHMYTYDDDGLLTGAGGFTIFHNAGNGLPESVTGGTINLSRTFSSYGEVAGQDFTIGGQDLTIWDLTRDDNGRITEKIETVDVTTSEYMYTYDPMGRLLTVTKDSTLVEEYEYGPNGTRTYEMNDLRGISGRTFAYSDEDHLLTAGGAIYEYDLDGFLTTKTDVDVTSYDYSTRGELLSVTLPDGRVIEYVHDPLGRRIAKKVDGAIVEKYFWQGLTRLLAVYDGSDNLLMRFEYADGRMPVAMTKGGSTYYLTYDQVGSLRIVADASGNVVKSIDYDSFGNIINDSDPTFEVPFRFAGGLYDKDTGLIRFGYRDYDPDIGRWTAKDLILFAGGDTDLYGYCLNDPINWVDPYGLLNVNSDLLAAGASLAGAGATQAGIGAALIATGNPIGIIPLALGTAKAAAGAYMGVAAFGYDFLNLFPGMAPKKSEANSHSDPCSEGEGTPLIGDFPLLPFA